MNSNLCCRSTSAQLTRPTQTVQSLHIMCSNRLAAYKAFQPRFISHNMSLNLSTLVNWQQVHLDHLCNELRDLSTYGIHLNQLLLSFHIFSSSSPYDRRPGWPSFSERALIKWIWPKGVYQTHRLLVIGALASVPKHDITTIFFKAC